MKKLTFSKLVMMMILLVMIVIACLVLGLHQILNHKPKVIPDKVPEKRVSYNDLNSDDSVFTIILDDTVFYYKGRLNMLYIYYDSLSARDLIEIYQRYGNDTIIK
uniref:Uncharacterized protein n=1 Tax=viral metagenome TaxID=1070528 RepID=A0A6M3KC91_9ZZZZ